MGWRLRNATGGSVTSKPHLRMPGSRRFAGGAVEQDFCWQTRGGGGGGRTVC